MKIKFLGTHSSENKGSRLLSFLINDFLAVDAGSLSSELTYEQQEKIGAIVLTHGHYDHIRSIPAFAFNNITDVTEVYALPQTLTILKNNLMDGQIYPDFSSSDSFLGKAILELIPITPLQSFSIRDYEILPVSVNHPIPTVGFQITDKDGKKLFYSGDTGPGLSEVWNSISPQLMIIDVSFPDNLETVARDSGHLCPLLLKKELHEFKRIKGYLPEISAIHLTPKYEDEIREEINRISNELGISIGITHENEERII